MRRTGGRAVCKTAVGRTGGRAVCECRRVTASVRLTGRPPDRRLMVRLTAVLLLFACTPVTTRPDFFPDSQAPAVTLMARPERVTAELPSLVAAESLLVERTNVRDGYLETAWYDTRTGRSRRGTGEVSDLAASVKIRFWADPYVPGQTRLTVEVVHRPRYDPSLTERDMEVIVPTEHAGHGIAERLIAKLETEFGTPKN